MSTPVEVLSLPASEEGTYAVDDIEFLDEDDTVLTPLTDTVTWSLCDSAENSIREDVAIASAASMTVTMSGTDLSVSGYPDKVIKRKGVKINTYERHLYVTGRVNSNLGNNLPTTKEFIFFIENIVCIQ